MSDYTQTPNLRLYKPTYDADDEMWGQHLNANADTLDAAIFGLPAPPQPATAPPLMDGTAAAGTSAFYTRADHVHPHDTTMLPLAGGTMTGPLNVTATGSTASRSVQDNFADRINVKDYGAKGDGATNDTTAIQSAVTAAASKSAGIYLPAGTYRVSHISYAPGLTGIVGAGRDQTILKRIDNDPGINALIMDSGGGVVGVDVSSLTIDGNKTNNTLGGYGILLSNGSSRINFTNLRVINVKAAAGYGSGIQLQNTVDGANGTFSFITDCIVSNNDYIGIGFYQTIANLTVQGCYAANNGDSGIGGGTTLNTPNQIVNCKIIGNTVINNKFGLGMGGGGQGWIFTAVQKGVISNNVVRGSIYNAIVYQGSYGVVSGNLISDNGTDPSTGPAGILFNAVESSITGNMIYNQQTFGIDAGGSVNCLIEGNLISNTHAAVGYGGGTALNVGAAQGTTVNDNLLINNVSQPGNEGYNIGISQYDFGGYAVPFQSKDVTISNNTIITPTTSQAWGIIGTGNVASVVIHGNVFKGGSNPYFYLQNPGSATVRDNLGPDPFGYQMAAAATLRYPDFTDTITLTGSTATTITLIQTNTQAGAAGTVAAVTITNGGSGYTSAPTVTISGTGSGATATATLDDSGHVAQISITAPGSGYTTATAAFSGGGGSGATATVQVGCLPTGRRLAVLNNSSANQTFQHNATQLMAAGVNLVVTPGGSVAFYHNSVSWCEISTSAALPLSGGNLTGGVEFKSGASLTLDQGVPFYLVDASGSSVFQWIDGGNNQQLVGTNASGGQRNIWNIVQHSNTSPFEFSVPVQFDATPTGTGLTNLFAAPPAIGGTVAAAGHFTTLGASGAGTFSSGISFGSQTATSTIDFSKHISLYGTTFGICVDNNANLQIVAQNGFTSQFTIGSTTVATVSGTSFNHISALQTGGSTGPTWTTGSAAPSSTQPVGSLYSRVGGAVGATLYVSRGGGTWNAVAGV